MRLPNLHASGEGDKDEHRGVADILVMHPRTLDFFLAESFSKTFAYDKQVFFVLRGENLPKLQGVFMADSRVKGYEVHTRQNQKIICTEGIIIGVADWSSSEIRGILRCY